jgi:predicted alpha/beta hydrolase family esterase
MARQSVLFIQGAGDMRHPEGSGHLADYLDQHLGSEYRVIAPEMPDADNPRYQPWRDQIERELAAIEGRAVLVGHSFGGSVLLKYLAEGSYRQPIDGLFLVAVPFWGAEFEEFMLPEDFAARLRRTKVFLYHSLDDPEVPFASLRRYEKELPNATSRPALGSEHSFVNGLPELVDDIQGGTG